MKEEQEAVGRVWGRWTPLMHFGVFLFGLHSWYYSLCSMISTDQISSTGRDSTVIRALPSHVSLLFGHLAESIACQSSLLGKTSIASGRLYVLSGAEQTLSV